MPPTLTRPVDVRNAWLIWLGFAIGVVLFAWSEGYEIKLQEMLFALCL